jgi:hypothetical protein
MAEWHVPRPQCRKGCVTLESPKILPEPPRQNFASCGEGFFCKLGLKDVLRNLSRAVGEMKPMGPHHPFNFTAYRI